MDSGQPSLLIAGSGAMACLFAARLSAAGIPVTMLGNWAEGLQALRRDGVRLVEMDGSETAYPVKVAGPDEPCPQAQFILVLVKSWQTARTARQIRRCLAADGLALTLQNGLGNDEALAGELGSERVALGITTAGANLLGPGRVRSAGHGEISVGEHPRLGGLVGLLSRAGFPLKQVADTHALLWGKLVINAAINPLTALLGVPNGELLAREPARALLASVSREAAAVAAVQGIQLPYPDPVAAAEGVAQRTATNRSSMLQDVQRGAPTEIDAICGAIVEAGERSHVPIPVNRTLWRLVKALVKADQGKQR